MDTVSKFRKSIMFAVKALLVFSTTFSFVETWTNHYMKALFSFRGNFVVILSFVLIFVTFSALYGAFRIGIYRIHELIYSFSLAILFTNAVMYLELSLVARELIAIRPMLFGMVYQFGIIAAGSCCANTIYFFVYRPSRMLALFSDDVTGFELIKKMSKISDRFHIERGMNAAHTNLEEVKRQIDKFEAVVLCDLDKNIQKELFSYCYATQKKIFLLPDISDILVNNSYGIQISDTPVLVSRNRGLSTEQMLVKRLCDLVVSLFFIILTSPIMLICAIAIKLDDGGPILFKQNRVT
ncbi:MAG: sugar transferase, partial [Clostridia bacterium]|nr:sugar transferase [Clostridia bacterium]